MEEHWKAVCEEAANPTDFLIAHDINLNDRLRGLFRYALDAIRYRILGGWKPLPLRQQIETANIERQIGPAREAEAAAWLKEEPFDFSEHSDFLNS
jgi:hypothetical protein